MSKDRGYYIEYTNKAGDKQKAMVYYSEQAQEFKAVKRLFCHLITDKMEPKLDATGKKLVSLIEQKKCRIIGYFD